MIEEAPILSLAFDLSIILHCTFYPGRRMGEETIHIGDETHCSNIQLLNSNMTHNVVL